MMASSVLRLPVGLLSIIALVDAQLPYNPTYILRNDTRAYVFQPSSGSQFSIGSLDLTTRLQASNLPITTLYSSLPFLRDASNRSFTPVIDEGGNVTVYTGECASGGTGAELWTFTADPSAKNGNGTWKQEKVSYQGSADNGATAGANFLSAGTSFSSIVGGDASETSAYYFGGMCPTPGASQQSWISSANYSNLMVNIQPQSPSKELDYEIGVLSNRGPPIAEAGFSMTGLEPSYTNKSDGAQTQQQSFVLMGGHTSQAFINMSQVALFSLPQQSWTFVPVQQPDGQRTDLTVRDSATEVEPRSGHSALLTPDGQRIVVLGGWIGDTSTPADPQLAVLNVGEGYGGQNGWQWTIPSTTGSGFANGAGIYGHGAIMLPGGVMMVIGGYSIPASSSRFHRSTSTTNTQTFFFNVTSNAWISDYSPPPQAASNSADGNTAGPLSTPSQKAGLGVGLTVGCAAIIGLLAFYVWYLKRTKKQRDMREMQLRELSMSAHGGYNFDGLSPGIDGRGGHVDAVDYFDDGHDRSPYATPGHQGWRQARGHEAERTGLLVEIPSPTRGLRRSLSGRTYHAAPRYDERRVRGSGNIHPIDELEEEETEKEQSQPEENIQLKRKAVPEMSMAERPQNISIFTNAPVLEPYTDKSPTSKSAPPSPGYERAEQLQNWKNDLEMAAGTLLPRRSSPSTSGGRTSPSKSDRTESNLSERSTRSNLTSSSGTGTLGRNRSKRSATLVNSTANPFATPDASPISPDRNSWGWAKETQTEPRSRSFTSIRSTRSIRPSTANGNDGDSFTTARTSFIQLQAEGEALLGGYPKDKEKEKERERPTTSSSSSNTNTQSYAISEAEAITLAPGAHTTAIIIDNPSRARPRRKSWLGSVRRALNRSSTVHAEDSKDRVGQIPAYEPEWGPSSRPPNPNRASFPSTSTRVPPRRAASDASFWRSKRGKSAWLDEVPDGADGRWRRNSGDDWGAPEDKEVKEREEREAEEEWDVEAAVERRVVQVMFTVPRQRLRVVNADLEESKSLESLRSEKLIRKKDDRDDETEGGKGAPGPSGSPSPKGKVKDLVGLFEGAGSPRGSPAPSIRSVKGDGSPTAKGKERAL